MSAPAEWNARAEWFARAAASNAGPEAPSLTEREDRLLGELEAAFCAGAWVACVLLAYSLAEGAARKRHDIDPEFELLRERRNGLAHSDTADLPPEETLELYAQSAVRMALRALGEKAWR
ncbi:MAG: hypothetical protein ACKO1J_04335 [Tagaea sp.]